MIDDVLRLQFALSFEEPKTDVAASATASSEQSESSGHQDVEVESESTTQSPPSSSTEMGKPSEALPQPEPPLYPQEHLQHQQDHLFAYFPGGHPLLGLTQVVISPQGEQNHILPPPSFPQVPQGHPQLHPHGGFAHPLLDLTHVAIQTNGLYPNMEYLLHPQDSYHPHSLVHLPHNDQGHPLVKPALHQGAGRLGRTRTRSRTKRTSSNVLPTSSLPGTQATSGSTHVGQGPLMLIYLYSQQS